MAAGDWLLDTNILLRMNYRHEQFESVGTALGLLVTRQARFCFTSQILGEFWNVCTRPKERNGLGLSIAETESSVRALERNLHMLPHTREVHDCWRRMLFEHEVKGVQVHDARIAASMEVHDVQNILTLNVSDFKRFSSVRAVHPSAIDQ